MAYIRVFTVAPVLHQGMIITSGNSSALINSSLGFTFDTYYIQMKPLKCCDIQCIMLIRWSLDGLIFIMGIAIPGKTVFILRWGLAGLMMGPKFGSHQGSWPRLQKIMLLWISFDFFFLGYKKQTILWAYNFFFHLLNACGFGFGSFLTIFIYIYLGLSAILWHLQPLLIHYHWRHSINSFPLDKMAAISQTIFSDAFSWMKSFVLLLKFHWSLFSRVQLIINQHWFM